MKKNKKKLRQDTLLERVGWASNGFSTEMKLDFKCKNIPVMIIKDGNKIIAKIIMI